MAEVKMECLRCGHEFSGPDDPEIERVCPKCRSNSVRVIKEPAKGQGA